MSYLLAGDIGGTKTVLGIYDPEKGPHEPLLTRTFASGHYPSLDAILEECLGETGYELGAGSFGVAGPVVGGRAATTNLPWQIDAAQLARRVRFSAVHLLNDLQATANAVPFLRPDQVHTLTAGEARPQGAIAVIAPGTGLGEAYLTWDGDAYRAHPSEGGHASFAPDNQGEQALLSYLREERGIAYVSYETVCSGRGILNLYAYLRDCRTLEEPDWLTGRLAGAADPTPVIVSAALGGDRRAGLAVETLNTFVSILGAEAGNLALKVAATGGVYLGGGIPPRIIPFLESGLFLDAFSHKGQLSTFMETVPVHIILDPGAALLGAACYGLQQMHGTADRKVRRPGAGALANGEAL